MAITRFLIVIGVLTWSFLRLAPSLMLGLVGKQLSDVRIAMLLVWGVLVLAGIIRSTKDVMWCDACTCHRCRAIKLRHPSP